MSRFRFSLGSPVKVTAVTFAATTAAALLMPASPAGAGVIDNPSFEAPDQGTGWERTAGDDWTAERDDVRNFQSGTETAGLIVQSEEAGDTPDAGTPNTDASDTQWQVFDQRGKGQIRQQIGTVQPNTVHELTIGQIGSRGDTPLAEDFFFGLYADASNSLGDTVKPANELATLSFDKDDAANSDLSFSDLGDNTKAVEGPFTVTFDSSNDAAYNGQNLFARIGIPDSGDTVPQEDLGTPQQILVDDVSAVVPAPGALPVGLALLGGMAMIRRRQRA